MAVPLHPDFRQAQQVGMRTFSYCTLQLLHQLSPALLPYPTHPLKLWHYTHTADPPHFDQFQQIMNASPKANPPPPPPTIPPSGPMRCFKFIPNVPHASYLYTECLPSRWRQAHVDTPTFRVYLHICIQIQIACLNNGEMNLGKAFHPALR